MSHRLGNYSLCNCTSACPRAAGLSAYLNQSSIHNIGVRKVADFGARHLAALPHSQLQPVCNMFKDANRLLIMQNPHHQPSHHLPWHMWRTGISTTSAFGHAQPKQARAWIAQACNAAMLHEGCFIELALLYCSYNTGMQSHNFIGTAAVTFWDTTGDTHSPLKDSRITSIVSFCCAGVCKQQRFVSMRCDDSTGVKCKRLGAR